MRTARITTMTTTTARWVAARPVGPRSILQSVVATHPKNNQNQQQSGTTSNTSNTNYYTNKSYTTTTTSTTTTHYSIHTNNRRLLSSFTWAGPRKLREILNVDNYNNDCGRQDDDSRLVSTPRQKKGGGRVRDAWEAHHLDQKHAVGLVWDGATGRTVLQRAKECPFYIQAVFCNDAIVDNNGNGTGTGGKDHSPPPYFMMVSQFMAPNHFLCTYLEEYQRNPNAATPWLSCTVFDEFAASGDLTLVRGDILNAINIPTVDMGRKIVASIGWSYTDDFYSVQAFTERPSEFDLDDAINRMKERWNATTA